MIANVQRQMAAFGEDEARREDFMWRLAHPLHGLTEMQARMAREEWAGAQEDFDAAQRHEWTHNLTRGRPDNG